MSFPNLPESIGPVVDLDRDDIISLLLASIAFEELGLSHIINAEAEKIQFVLGTLPDQVTTAQPTIDDLLTINRSVERILRDVIKKEMLLEFNLENVLDLIGSACTPTTAEFTNPTPISINDTQASPYPSSINVAGLTGTVAKVTVTLSNMSHTFPDDVDILLVGPQGQSVILMSDAGWAADIVNVTLTFDDDAPTSLPDNGPIVSGTFQPTNFGDVDAFPVPAPPPPYGLSLASSFNGTNPNGTWNLFVFDDTGGDSGSIAGGWSLTIRN